MSRKTGTERQFSRSLRPIGQAVLGADIEPLVRDVCRRIRAIRRDRVAGSFVLADADGYVYVLQDESMTTQDIVRREAALVVGFYASRPGQVYFPSDEDLRMDLIAHFFEVGFLKPEMIYGEVEHSR